MPSAAMLRDKTTMLSTCAAIVVTAGSVKSSAGT